jgi:hypothetical protein
VDAVACIRELRTRQAAKVARASSILVRICSFDENRTLGRCAAWLVIPAQAGIQWRDRWVFAEG